MVEDFFICQTFGLAGARIICQTFNRTGGKLASQQVELVLDASAKPVSPDCIENGWIKVRSMDLGLTPLGVILRRSPPA